MPGDRSSVVVSITDFLLARIAEDESMAVAEQSADQDGNGKAAELGAHAARLVGPARVLAECRSRRGILAEHPAAPQWGPGDQQIIICDQCSELLAPGRHLLVAYPCPTVRHLAAVYSEHRQYRDEWQPR